MVGVRGVGLLTGRTGRGGHYFLSDCSVAGTIKEGDKKVIFHDDRHERREVESSHGLISCGVSADEGGTTVTGGKPYFPGIQSLN